MNPLELETYHQIKNGIGVNPTFYEYLFSGRRHYCGPHVRQSAHICVSSFFIFSLSPVTQSHSMITTTTFSANSNTLVSLPYLVVFLKRGYF
jgi:hypothetical protein